MGRRNESPEKKRRRELIKELLKDTPIENGADINSLMREMMAEVLNGSLEGELDDELGYTRYDYRNKETENSRNGFSIKTMHTSYGDMELDVPRDRAGYFEPKIVAKHQNTLSQDIEEKILSMYAKGMSTGDIESHVNELYGVDISDSTISRITDKILPIVREWQQRPLEEIILSSFFRCYPLPCKM